MKQRLWLLAFFALVSDLASAQVYAEVQFDMVAGWLHIQTPKYSEGEGHFIIGEQSCFLCFSTASSRTKEVDLDQNSYFILTGHPDDLGFELFQYICSSDGKTAIGALVSRWRMQAMKGQLRVRAHFIMGKNSLNQLNEIGVCSDEYRQANNQFRLAQLPQQTDIFSQNYRSGRIEVNWDPHSWVDPETARANETLQKVDRILNR